MPASAGASERSIRQEKKWLFGEAKGIGRRGEERQGQHTQAGHEGKAHRGPLEVADQEPLIGKLLAGWSVASPNSFSYFFSRVYSSVMLTNALCEGFFEEN